MAASFLWADEPAVIPATPDERLVAILQPLLAQQQVPALGAAVVTSQGVHAVATVGVRVRGRATAVELHDRWHLGSCTKAMTATLAARFVEQHRLRWNSTLAETLGPVALAWPQAAQAITLEDLLRHRAGVPANTQWRLYDGIEDVRGKRQRIAELHLATLQPSATRQEYSNLGYMLAGVMLERVADRSWETLLQTEVFQPLGMSTAGFGAAGDASTIDQPWGHTTAGEAISPASPEADNAPVLGPAGTVHASLHNWGLFAVDQLRGAQGQPARLAHVGSYRKLQTPHPGDEYAMGWLVLKRPWAKQAVLHHAGTNTLHSANAWIIPEKNLGILVCTNQGGPAAFAATDQAVARILTRFDPVQTPLRQDSQQDGQPQGRGE